MIDRTRGREQGLTKGGWRKRRKEGLTKGRMEEGKERRTNQRRRGHELGYGVGRVLGKERSIIRI
jgi:hypothetical protein